MIECSEAPTTLQSVAYALHYFDVLHPFPGYY
ncbi:Bgt-51070 [Blumeria graminis f. sp. tritici]|uniref:Bgt-51070 n=1 Tax=Blumeria graminis f. sp. tritici TaxID=62690 RepID=A0A9X9MIN5_BLUGR|nr:Bgt-51070 [Blumeria graminis f. sp. tritici]